MLPKVGLVIEASHEIKAKLVGLKCYRSSSVPNNYSAGFSSLSLSLSVSLWLNWDFLCSGFFLRGHLSTSEEGTASACPNIKGFTSLTGKSFSLLFHFLLFPIPCFPSLEELPVDADSSLEAAKAGCCSCLASCLAAAFRQRWTICPLPVYNMEKKERKTIKDLDIFFRSQCALVRRGVRKAPCPQLPLHLHFTETRTRAGPDFSSASWRNCHCTCQLPLWK